MAIARIEGRQDDQPQIYQQDPAIFQTVLPMPVVVCGNDTAANSRLSPVTNRVSTIDVNRRCELWMLEHCREALNALFA